MKRLILLMVQLLYLCNSVDGAAIAAEERKTKDYSNIAQAAVFLGELGLGTPAPGINNNETIFDICRNVNTHNVLDFNVLKISSYIAYASAELDQTVETATKMERAVQLLYYIDCLIASAKKMQRDLERFGEFAMNASKKTGKLKLSQAGAKMIRLAADLNSTIADAEKDKEKVLKILGILNDHLENGITMEQPVGNITANTNEEMKENGSTGETPEPGTLDTVSYETVVEICNAPKSTDGGVDKLWHYAMGALAEMNKPEEITKKMDRATKLLPILECLIEAYKNQTKNFEQSREDLIKKRNDEKVETTEMWDILIATMTQVIGGQEFFINYMSQQKQQVKYFLDILSKEYAKFASNGTVKTNAESSQIDLNGGESSGQEVGINGEQA